jgi:transcriptional regulator with XRE-family HTH domain
MRPRDRISLHSAQVRAGRALAGMTIDQLADVAGVGVMTVRRAEASEGPVSVTFPNAQAIRTALEAAGVIFIEENGEGPGVRLRKSDK